MQILTEVAFPIRVLLFTFYFLLFTFYFLLFTFYFLLFTFYFLLFTFYFLLFTFYFLLFTFYFLIQHFFKFILQIIATEFLGDHFSGWVNEHIKWNALKAEGLYRLAIPVFQVADMSPCKMILGNGFFPSIFVFVQ